METSTKRAQSAPAVTSEPEALSVLSETVRGVEVEVETVMSALRYLDDNYVRTAPSRSFSASSSSSSPSSVEMEAIQELNSILKNVPEISPKKKVPRPGVFDINTGERTLCEGGPIAHPPTPSHSTAFSAFSAPSFPVFFTTISPLLLVLFPQERQHFLLLQKR